MRPTILLLAACSAWAAEESTRTIDKSFPLTGADRSVAVCGLNGFVRVTGTDSNEVRISVQEKLSAGSRDRLDELKREVDVVFNAEPGRVRAGIKSPWNDGDCGNTTNRDRNRGERRWDGRDTRIEHEFTVSVPRTARIELRNVNGSVEVTGTTGPYSVGTVNGGIRMVDVEGSGSVNTVNGSLTVSYRKNPEADTKFRTVNGKVNLYFQPVLSADFEVKTVNGKAFTDFDMVAIPTTGSLSTRSDGMKVVYRRGNSGSMRAGNGGPKFLAETVNGEILIHSLAKGRP